MQTCAAILANYWCFLSQPDLSAVGNTSMDQANLYCDQPHCGRPAIQFGFAQSTTKTKVCATHSSLLQSDVYDISALQFFQTPDDKFLYERRRELMLKGLQNITKLDRKCAEELEVALNCLQCSKAKAGAVVERSFEEMELRVQSRFAEVKQVLEQLRVSLENLTVEKQCQLSLADSALCGEVPEGPMFRVVLGDCVLPVAELLMSSFYLLPIRESERTGLFARSSLGKLKAFAQEKMQEGNADVAKATEDYINEIGDEDFHLGFPQIEARRNYKKAKRLQSLLPGTATDAEVRQVTEAYAKASAEPREAGNYDIALQKAQRGRSWTQQLGRESPEICLELGLGLAHLAQWSEADAVLRQGLDLEMISAPDSELAKQLSNAIAETYLQAGQCVNAKTVCEWTLSTWELNGNQFELLRALCLLYCSVMGYNGGESFCESIGQRSVQLVADSPRNECLLQFALICEQMVIDEDEGELKYLIEEALQKALDLLPNSYLTLFLWHFYMIQSESYPDDDENSKKQLTKAYHICTVHYPRSFEFTFILFLWEDLHDMEEEHIAEQHLLQALQILTDYFPLPPHPLPEDFEEHFNEHLVTIIRIECLKHLAKLYKRVERFQESEIHHLALYELLKAYRSGSSELANCVEDLGDLYREAGRWEEAEQKSEEARALFESSYLRLR